jgi:hypothetical protein
MTHGIVFGNACREENRLQSMIALHSLACRSTLNGESVQACPGFEHCSLFCLWIPYSIDPTCDPSQPIDRYLLLLICSTSVMINDDVVSADDAYESTVQLHYPHS